MNGDIYFLDLVTKSFVSAQEFILLYDDIMEQISEDDCLTNTEKNEEQLRYSFEIIENIRNLCGFAICDVSYRYGISLLYHNTNNVLTKDRPGLLDMMKFVYSVCERIFLRKEMEEWMSALKKIDTAYVNKESLTAWHQNDFIWLLRECGHLIEKLLEVDLHFDDELETV